MKKNNPLYLILFAALLLLGHCRKEEIDTNLSSVFSVQSGVSEAVRIPYSTLDNSGNYLYIFARDLSYATSQILKINLSANRVEKQFTFDPSTTANLTIPISAENVTVTSNNELIGSFYSYATDKTLLIKFDADLNVMKIVTSADGDYGRTRIIGTAPGKITGLFGNWDTVTGRWFFRYQRMDENLNILSSVTDTSSFYGYAGLLVNNFVQTSDGGYLFAAGDFGSEAVVLEKRDIDFNLKWRTRYNWGNPLNINELNGKYYVYCQSDSVFTLIYDLNGKLLNRVNYNIPGATLSILSEPMRKTDNGEFLITAKADYKYKPNTQAGVLIHTDANANIISHQVFSDKKMLGAGLIKVNSNKFLLFYLDANFKSDGGRRTRFVIRYVDAKGNFIN